MVKDHLGNEYKSYTELGKKYGLSKTTITRRLKKGYTLEETLTIPLHKATKRHQVYDHLGNKFNSLTTMLKHYNISYRVLTKRLKDNWELEKALTTPTTKSHKKSYRPNKLCDHLGNEYKTINDLCAAYGISISTYYTRIKYEWSLEDRLTIPPGEHRPMYDHLGNKFKSKIKMCEYYNINYDTFKNRMEHNWTLEKALTTPSIEIIQYDHLGNIFESKTKLCEHYGITTQRFNYFKDKGYSIEECLNIIPKINAKTKNIEINNTFIIKECVTKTNHEILTPNMYFLCSHDNIDLILSREAIINYYRQNILKTA